MASARPTPISAGWPPLHLGIPALPYQGTYFLNVDRRAMGLGWNDAADDVAFCTRLTAEAGVAAIPLSAFYEEAPDTDHIRFCFAKQDAVLAGAVERLGRAVRGAAAGG